MTKPLLLLMLGLSSLVIMAVNIAVLLWLAKLAWAAPAAFALSLAFVAVGAWIGIKFGLSQRRKLEEWQQKHSIDPTSKP